MSTDTRHLPMQQLAPCQDVYRCAGSLQTCHLSIYKYFPDPHQSFYCLGGWSASPCRICAIKKAACADNIPGRSLAGACSAGLPLCPGLPFVTCSICKLPVDWLQEADTARLTVPDKAQRDWVNAGFKAAAAQFAQRVPPKTAAVHGTDDPEAIVRHLLAAHIHQLPKDARMKERVLRVYHELLAFAQPVVVTTFNVLEHPSSTVADVMQAVRQARDKFSRDGAILVKAGSASFSMQRKLGRFVQHGGQIRAWPGEEQLGEGGLWSSQDMKVASATVHDMAVWGQAVEDAVSKLASHWGLSDIADQPLQQFLLHQRASALPAYYSPHSL